MSRWIDADALTKRVEDSNKSAGLHLEDLQKIRRWIKTAPSIDIVRCAECKHREKYPCDEIEFYECGHLRLHGTKVGVKDDWFCADGEREGE